MENFEDTLQKLLAMISRHRFAMFTTREPSGVLRSRPMTLLQSLYDGDLWFFAETGGAVAKAIHGYSNVFLSFGNSAQSQFVSIAGNARIVMNVEKKRQMWNSETQTWFPGGPESPEVTLIQVTPDHGEYWDSNSNKLVQQFSIAREVAAATISRDFGEHREVSL